MMTHLRYEEDKKTKDNKIKDVRTFFRLKK